MSGLGQWRELVADNGCQSASQMSFRYLAPNHLGVESIPIPMRCEMDMEVGNPSPENVDVDQLGLRRIFQCSSDKGEYWAERSGFVAIQVSDVRHMAFRFEIGETGDLALLAGGESPERIFPDLDDSKLLISGRSATKYARRFRRGHGRLNPMAN
jgi:hypothetical protein